MISLEQALNDRVLMLNASPRDPAWSDLPDSAWGGGRFVWSPNLNVTRPDLVLEWNAGLLSAGADILDTNSYGADPFTAQEQYDADRSLRREWNRAAVAIARRATGGQKFLVGTVGPTADFFHVHSFAEHVEAF